MIPDIRIDAGPAALTVITVKIHSRYFDAIVVLIVPNTDTTVGVFS